MHAKWILTFAQTYVNNTHEGIHVFLVPIRDENMKEKNGVLIHDMGMKLGCNGVDNAKLWFKNIRIPARYLLSK